MTKPTYRMTKTGDNLYTLKIGRDAVGYIRQIGTSWEATDRGVFGVGPSPLIAFDRWLAKRKAMDEIQAKRGVPQRSFSFEKPAPVRKHDKRNPRKYKHQDWKYEDDKTTPDYYTSRGWTTSEGPTLRDEMPEAVREPELSPAALQAMPMPVIEFTHRHLIENRSNP